MSPDAIVFAAAEVRHILPAIYAACRFDAAMFYAAV